MVTLLAWCFGDSMDWSLVGALMQGYCRHTSLNQPDLEACYDQARAACVRFAVTRITDYELRSESEVAFKDYRRFMQRLNVVEELGPERFVTKLSPA